MTDADVMAESYLMNSNHLAYDLRKDGSSSENGIPKPECRFCGKTFAQFGYVKAHERIHTGEKPYECRSCGKRFTDQSNWKKHERMHLRQIHFVASKGPLIQEDSSLTADEYSERPKEKVTSGLDCYICGKVFSTPYTLSIHKRIHAGKRPYTCNVCGKSFTQIGTLKAHERIHSGERPYVCRICGKTFRQCGIHRIHERKHFADSNQSCHICFKSLSSWHELHEHISLTHPQINLPANLRESDELLLNDDVKLTSDDEMNSSSLEDITSSEVSNPDVMEKLTMASLYSASPEQPFHQQFNNTTDNHQPMVVFPTPSIKHEDLEILNQQQSNQVSQSYPTCSTVIDLADNASPQTDNDIVTTTSQDGKLNQQLRTTIKLEPSEQAEHDDNDSVESTHIEEMDDGQMQITVNRENLNTRLTSGNSRKQKHPMKICSVGPTFDPTVNQKLMSLESKVAEFSDDDIIDYLLTRGNLYKCEHCQILFKDCTLYLLHNGLHSHDADPFKCVICKESCNNRVDFNCHLTSHIK